MNIETVKKQKLQGSFKRSLFGALPDETVLIILSYGTIEDIQSTRVWQSEKVKHFTELTCKIKVAENDNMENMKWVYEDIGDIESFEVDPSRDYNANSFCTAGQLKAFTIIKKLLITVFVDWAAQNDNIGMLKWLNEKNCSWGNKTLGNAIQHCDIEVMGWLKIIGCHWYSFS